MKNKNTALLNSLVNPAHNKAIKQLIKNAIASIITAGSGVCSLTANNLYGSATGLNTASVTGTPSASGGIITYFGGYIIHIFTTSDNFVRGGCGTAVDIFLVGGGGSGGCFNNGNDLYPEGGGGGYTRIYTNVPVTGTVPITVGSGGAGVGENNIGNTGGYSRFGSTATYQANGGAGGGSVNVGDKRVFGGGGRCSFDGTNGSGGVGQRATTKEFDTGIPYSYGGGAGSFLNWNAFYRTYTGNGIPNTGGGGGGRATYSNSGNSGDGGSGIVIIRYIP
ncbi:MAG: hypothetical protein A3F72_06080 [Bacteroidetes bacterium RIFCSPLOWO2_12_FULL_35_15]|nr:MAG: hypothetical protein A3F72_06080 [Bacteroidetes bacterium RIFCSPLOWO2_12_FULL_35_15]